MTTVLHYPGIKGIEFINNTILFIHLDNDRTFIVPVDKFPALKNLTSKEKHDFEIIDDKHLSFLSIDEVFGIEELIGIEY